MNVLETVSPSNHLGFQDHPEKVVNFLSFSHKDVSSAIGLPKPAIVKMSPEVIQRLAEIANICEIVANYFRGDEKKTALWFQIPNPILGNIPPRDMIRVGRYRKLIKIVSETIAGDLP